MQHKDRSHPYHAGFKREISILALLFPPACRLVPGVRGTLVVKATKVLILYGDIMMTLFLACSSRWPCFCSLAYERTAFSGIHLSSILTVFRFSLSLFCVNRLSGEVPFVTERWYSYEWWYLYRDEIAVFLWPPYLATAPAVRIHAMTLWMVEHWLWLSKRNSKKLVLGNRSVSEALVKCTH